MNPKTSVRNYATYFKIETKRYCPCLSDTTVPEYTTVSSIINHSCSYKY